MSYQAAHDPRLHFGLGNSARVESLEVEWPSGAVDKIRDVAADRYVAVKEGAGEVQPCCRPFRDKPAAKRR
jgi:hypothetical protein